MKRTTSITVETDRVFVVRRRKIQDPRWCEECGGRSPMITPDEAAALAAVGTRTVYRWIERGGLHFNESRETALLICVESLLEQTRS